MNRKVITGDITEHHIVANHFDMGSNSIFSSNTSNIRAGTFGFTVIALKDMAYPVIYITMFPCIVAICIRENVIDKIVGVGIIVITAQVQIDIICLIGALGKAAILIRKIVIQARQLKNNLFLSMHGQGRIEYLGIAGIAIQFGGIFLGIGRKSKGISTKYTFTIQINIYTFNRSKSIERMVICNFVYAIFIRFLSPTGLRVIAHQDASIIAIEIIPVIIDYCARSHTRSDLTFVTTIFSSKVNAQDVQVIKFYLVRILIRIAPIQGFKATINRLITGHFDITREDCVVTDTAHNGIVTVARADGIVIRSVKVGRRDRFRPS